MNTPEYDDTPQVDGTSPCPGVVENGTAFEAGWGGEVLGSVPSRNDTMRFCFVFSSGAFDSCGGKSLKTRG